MFFKILIYLKNFDWPLFLAIILLISFGLAEIYSVDLSRGENFDNFTKQFIFAIIGLIIFFILSFFDYRNFWIFSNYFYIIGALSLVLVLFLGTIIRGTRGWFDFGIFGFQPVEIAKVFLIIFLAKYFSNSSIKIKQLKHLFFSGLVTLLFFILVLLQPDFGSGLLLLSIWIFMLIFVGIEKKYFLAVGLSVIFLSVVAWNFYLQPYQKERVMTFINPEIDSMSRGYNVAQAIIAVGSGGLLGRGIGFGSQSQLKFLPESQTDFIFAVVSEELGFLGVSLIFLFFSVFFFRCLSNIKKIKDNFGIFFILGSSSLIFVEMFVNIGMNIGLLPVVGISLPFMSYGGSAMLSNMIMVGIIHNIIIKSRIR